MYVQALPRTMSTHIVEILQRRLQRLPHARTGFTFDRARDDSSDPTFAVVR
jgi:hypothetical protein